MEDSKDMNEFKDPFLQKMILKLPVERTTGDFTMQIMNQIYASVEPELEPAKYRRQMIWAYASIGVGIIIIALLVFAIWPFINFDLKFNPNQVLNFINASLNIFNGISKVADYIKESSLPLSIFVSVFVLFIVERLLRKRIPNNNSYLL
ncbi:MAG: hypothetical protein ACM3PX_00335 [Omnitrophica WOR_2 bacterium]|jgi:ABC-type anion transport system duplicated permease subunit